MTYISKQEFEQLEQSWRSEHVRLIERIVSLEKTLAESERKMTNLRDSWAEESEARRKTVRQLTAVYAGVENVWMWLGDGSDEVSSLACPVVMEAETARELERCRLELEEIRKG